MLCRYNSVDINVAVATDRGLITPIVFNADTKVMQPVSFRHKHTYLSMGTDKILVVNIS